MIVGGTFDLFHSMGQPVFSAQVSGLPVLDAVATALPTQRQRRMGGKLGAKPHTPRETSERLGERGIWWIDTALWVARQHPKYWWANTVLDLEDDPSGSDLVYGWAADKAMRLTGKVGRSVVRQMEKGIHRRYGTGFEPLRETFRTGGSDTGSKSRWHNGTWSGRGAMNPVAGSAAFFLLGGLLLNSTIIGMDYYGLGTEDVGMDVM